MYAYFIYIIRIKYKLYAYFIIFYAYGVMKKSQKTRLNLYISQDIREFAKEWSYVTGKPISKMLEDYLTEQKRIVLNATPLQWLNDPLINPTLLTEDIRSRDLDEYIQNREEELFCQQNPEHPRAKMRKTLVEEHEKYVKDKMERQKESEKDLIKRWMEVFPLK